MSKAQEIPERRGVVNEITFPDGKVRRCDGPVVQKLFLAYFFEAALFLEHFHNFFLKQIFPEGLGGVQNAFGNSGGVEVYFSFKKWKFQGGGGRGGSYLKFPPW